VYTLTQEMQWLVEWTLGIEHSLATTRGSTMVGP
jgi:hypothetical protein